MSHFWRTQFGQAIFRSAPSHTVQRLVGIVTLACASSTWAATSHAASYYVAVDGNDANQGTLDRPFATIARGQQAASRGDTVHLRGGTFRFQSNSAANGVALNKSGTSGNPITYAAYEAEVPVFDFSGMTASERITGIRVTASWIHLKGIEVKRCRRTGPTKTNRGGSTMMGATTTSTSC